MGGLQELPANTSQVLIASVLGIGKHNSSPTQIVIKVLFGMLLQDVCPVELRIAQT
jgi:hypothetical protein